jgi:hypothetical protein
LCDLRLGDAGFDEPGCANGGGDRNRSSLGALVACWDDPPVVFRFFWLSPVITAPHKPKLAQTDSRFLLDLDEPDGVPGRFELLPLCVAGGCQWWK